MRILFFLESLHGGGKERRASELIGYLTSRYSGYEIELVLTEDEIYYEDVLNAGIEITVLKRKGFKYDPGIFFRFYKVCRRFKPDIIHSWGKMATFYAIPTKLTLGIPLVASLIADTIRGYGRVSRYAFLLRINSFFSDVILSNSQAGLETYKVSEQKSKVIYNGVSLSRFRGDFDKSEVKAELGVVTPFMVVMVATFSTFKDYDLFINTAKKIAQNRDDVTFVAVGDGPELSRIRYRVEEESVRNVVLAGRRKNVERIVSASDIGLLCTKSEGISNSIIEYMAMGKPVIASDVTGGSRELVEEGVTGYCTERDSVVISDLINMLLDDGDLRFRLGVRGKERIENDFSIDRMGEEFISLYDEVLSERGRKRPALYENKVV